MTAALGALVANRVSTPLYLDIRDIFTDTMQDILAGRALRHLVPFFKKIERYTVRSSERINLVSGGFEEHFRALAPDREFTVYTNGIDEEFLDIYFANPIPNPRPVILYAGNIGEGQGLHRVLPEAARQLVGRAKFLVIGDGGARIKLERAILLSGIDNIEVVPPVPRAQLLQFYKKADVLFLHLNDYDAFRRVLPSKIFEYAATGKPILAGVGGYAREFISKNISNAVVFNPCDPRGLMEGFGKLKHGLVTRKDFIRRFSRTRIMADMARDILSLSQKAKKTVDRPE